MDQIVHYGREGAAGFVREFAATGQVALVTGNSAYRQSGAEDLFGSAMPNATVQRLTVKTPNPRVDEVQGLLDELEGRPPSAFVAVGGGTVIDTAKILNLAVSVGKDVKSILRLDLQPQRTLPCLAAPTTAGTGAEATRFAVCYEGEMKHSVESLKIRPSHVLLLPGLTASLPPYQKASTNFDAYAQAVESLWAKGATDESNAYARRALDYMAAGDWTRGAYWAGRAIDISRTTAAHAFSYYLTGHYGIPHGHAVYMVFEFICRNNGRPECIKTVPELKTLRTFADEKGVEWSRLVEELFAHVNLERLGNNPVEVKKESFL